MIHVDSSFIIDLIREGRRQRGRAHAWLQDHGDDVFGISLFALCELEAGSADARDPEKERQAVAEVLLTIDRVYPDDRFVRIYGTVASRLQRAGRAIGTMDTLIAATALVNNAALVTANKRHFEGVPGLRVLAYR